MTRTPVVRKSSEKHKEIYEIVKEAQKRGCEIAKAGVPCKDVDFATRDYISKWAMEILHSRYRTWLRIRDTYFSKI